MVYYGIPSQGCQMCRIRKIKCDEARPACNRCIKSRKQCPGYRDTVDLLFKDQTQATERKANTRHIPKRSTTKNSNVSQTTQAPPSAESIRSNPPPSEYLTDHFTAAAAPQIPIQDLATCHFIANYVLIPRQYITTTRGFLEFVIPLLGAEEQLPHFKYAFEACALASLNNRVGTGNDFDKLALGKYTKALAATFSALKDPAMIKHDATLGAILLLGLFENITAKSMGMVAWSSHIEGAIQLVKVRGHSQLGTKTGMDLFIAVRTQMLIHSLSTGKATNLGIEWWVSDPNTEEHAMECLHLGIRTGELRTKVNHLLLVVARTPEDIAQMNEVVQKCKALDKELVSWSKTLPDSFDWKMVAWQDNIPQQQYAKSEVFPGRVDAYQDLWVTNLWNVMRCARIVLASLVTRCTAWLCAPIDYRTTPEYAATSRICIDAIADIIASVPYQLGWFSKHKDLLEKAGLSSSDCGVSAFGCGEDDAEKGLSGYFLLWPLTCIQGLDYLTENQRIWVKGRLVCIGNQLGVRHGNMLSQLNIRTPSMLIMRDSLMNKSYNMPAAVTGMASVFTQGAGGSGVSTGIYPGMVNPPNDAVKST